MDPSTLSVRPAPRPDELDLELRLCPARDREDAMQEAWLAALEGRNPARAVNTFAQRERRHRRREAAMPVEAARSFKLSAIRARGLARRNARRDAALSEQARDHA
jgi:hypothetical protein